MALRALAIQVSLLSGVCSLHPFPPFDSAFRPHPQNCGAEWAPSPVMGPVCLSPRPRGGRMSQNLQ